MKKSLICLLLVVLMAFSLTSCFRSEINYDYDDFSKFIKLPEDAVGHKLDFELVSLQAAIDSYLLKYATEYKIERGDDIYVNFKLYEENVLVDEKTGKEYIVQAEEPSVTLENYLVKNVGAGTIGSAIENLIIGKGIGDSAARAEYKPKPDGTGATELSDFYLSEYKNKHVYIEIQPVNKVTKVGDVVSISYKGYLLDKDGNKKKGDDGKELDPFDKSDASSYYLGSHLAIEDFETNLVGKLLNQEFSFNATFPDDYETGDEKLDLKGQTVLFEVTIKSLYEAPVYDNAFVKTYFSNYTTTKELEEDIKKDYILATVYDYILNNSEVLEYPSYEYKQHMANLEKLEPEYYENYKVTVDEYLKKQHGMTREEYVKSSMKGELIFYSLSKQYNLVPTDAMLQNEKTNLLDYYKSYYMSYQGLDEATALNAANDFIEKLGTQYIYDNVMYTMVEEFLVSKAVVTEIPIPEDKISITATLNKPVTE